MVKCTKGEARLIQPSIINKDKWKEVRSGSDIQGKSWQPSTMVSATIVYLTVPSVSVTGFASQIKERIDSNFQVSSHIYCRKMIV